MCRGGVTPPLPACYAICFLNCLIAKYIITAPYNASGITSWITSLKPAPRIIMPLKISKKYVSGIKYPIKLIIRGILSRGKINPLRRMDGIIISCSNCVVWAKLADFVEIKRPIDKLVNKKNAERIVSKK